MVPDSRIRCSTGLRRSWFREAGPLAVADKDLRDAVRIGELQNSVNGVVTMENLDSRLGLACRCQIRLQGCSILCGKLGLLHIGHEQIAMNRSACRLAREIIRLAFERGVIQTRMRSWAP